MLSIARTQCLLNEFLIDADDENTGEFIEIYNGSPAALRLDACYLCDEQDTDAVIPFPDSLLLPGSYGIVLDPGYVGEYEHLIPDSVPRFSIEDARFGMYGISNSTSKPFALLDPGKRVLDIYITGTPCWAPPGHSMERHAFSDSLWQPSLHAGGTPGFRNSTAIREKDITIRSVNCSASNRRIFLEIVLQNSGRKPLSDLSGSFSIGPAGDFPQLSAEGCFDTTFTLAPGDSCRITVSAALKVKGRLNATVLADAGDVRDTLIKSVNIPLNKDEIIITEFVCKSGDRFPLEYVECCSRSAYPLQCRGLYFADESDCTPIEDDYLLMPDSFLVLAPGPEFREYFPQVSNVLFPSAWRSLNNSGDAISVLNPSGTTVCSLNYGPDWQIPADCAMLLADTGLDYRDPYFWEPSESGSPGKMNAVQKLPRHFSSPENGAFFTAGDTLIFHLINDGYFPVPAQTLCLETTLKQVFTSVPESRPGDTLQVVPDTAGTFPCGTGPCRLYCPGDSTVLDINFLYYYPYAETPLLFNEILFDPADAYGQSEFIEFECRQENCDLSGWGLNINKRHALLSGIFERGFLVAGSVREPPALLSDKLYLALDDFPDLPNSGALCVLLDPMGRVMDSCNLRDHPSLIPGKSMEKSHEGLASGNPELWHECVSAQGMTPGKRNSITALPALRDHLGIDPQVFSPGEDTHICFHIDSQKGIDYCELYCFNMAGQVVYRHTCGVFSSPSLKVFWDGRRVDGEYPARGIYPVLAVLRDVNGSLRYLKNTLIVR